MSFHNYLCIIITDRYVDYQLQTINDRTVALHKPVWYNYKKIKSVVVAKSNFAIYNSALLTNIIIMIKTVLYSFYY